MAEPEQVARPTAPLEHEERRGRFTIIGSLREAETGRPLTDLVVRAFDKDLFFDDDLGDATTDREGRFEIQFTDEFFRDLMEEYPDIYLRIFDSSGAEELLNTERSVRWNAGSVETFEIEIPRERLGRDS